MIDNKAVHKFSYGLFVLTVREGEKDSGCIINTAQQLTSSPLRLSIAVNKQNYTYELIRRTGMFNISVLDETVRFPLFTRFGFQSGRDADKFDNFSRPRTENGIAYIADGANAVFSCRVVQETDCQTHTLFIAEVTEARVLSDVPSVTYAYYFANIKPKPQPQPEKKGWVCKVCGYVCEGEELPADFTCPLCGHGVQDFEKLGG